MDSYKPLDYFSALNVVKNICQIAFGSQSSVIVPCLSVSIDLNDPGLPCSHNADRSLVQTKSSISLRSLLSIAFLSLGVEIAFSGKGQNERGVIIDVDREVITKLKISDKYLNLGTTVIQVDASSSLSLENDLSLTKNIANHENEADMELIDLVDQMVYSGLKTGNIQSL